MSDYRHVKWWLPAIMNWLCLPGFIFRQWRRDEYADLINTAYREGYKHLVPEFQKKHPRRAPTKRLAMKRKIAKLLQ